MPLWIEAVTRRISGQWTRMSAMLMRRRRDLMGEFASRRLVHVAASLGAAIVLMLNGLFSLCCYSRRCNAIWVIAPLCMCAPL